MVPWADRFVHENKSISFYHRACLLLWPHSLLWFGVCSSGLNGPRALAFPEGLGLQAPPCPASALGSPCLILSSYRTQSAQWGPGRVVVSSWPKADRDGYSEASFSVDRHWYSSVCDRPAPNVSACPSSTAFGQRGSRNWVHILGLNRLPASDVCAQPGGHVIPFQARAVTHCSWPPNPVHSSHACPPARMQAGPCTEA